MVVTSVITRTPLPSPFPPALPLGIPWGWEGTGRRAARCRNEWDHATAALGELMRQKKAPAEALSTAAGPALTPPCCLPAHGTQPCSVVFIPARGPGPAPGHTNLDDAINNPLCSLTPAWASGANSLLGPKAAAWHSRRRYIFTPWGAMLALAPSSGTPILAHPTLSLSCCNTPGWQGLTLPPTQTEGGELAVPLPRGASALDKCGHCQHSRAPGEGQGPTPCPVFSVHGLPWAQRVGEDPPGFKLGRIYRASPRCSLGS